MRAGAETARASPPASRFLDSQHDRDDRSPAAPATAQLDGLSAAALLDGSPIPTFIVDANRVITHLNRACADMLSVNARDVIGNRSLGLLLYGQPRPVLAELVAEGCTAEDVHALYGDRCRSASNIPGAFEGDDFYPHLGAQGRWLFFTAAPLRNRRGAIIGAIETVLDISHTKRTESALLKAQQALKRKLSVAQNQLMQTEKLASIGQLAAGVAHEINNPIGYIFSNFGTLERYQRKLLDMIDAYEKAEASHGVPATVARLQDLRTQIELDYLKQDIPALMHESREGIERVRKIVQDLKDFSRVDSTHDWHRADLCQCIASTLNVVNNELKYKADVVRDLVPMPEVHCRPTEINQVIANLLVNAAQSINQQRGTITVRNGTDSDTVWFEIEDTGAGIAPEQLARIFDPFFTTKPIGKGTGLGLSISYGIVQKHHGQITVRSVVGQGSAFRVTLPIEQRAMGSSAAPDTP